MKTEEENAGKQSKAIALMTGAAMLIALFSISWVYNQLDNPELTEMARIIFYFFIISIILIVFVIVEKQRKVNRKELVPPAAEQDLPKKKKKAEKELRRKKIMLGNVLKPGPATAASLIAILAVLAIGLQMLNRYMKLGVIADLSRLMLYFLIAATAFLVTVQIYLIAIHQVPQAAVTAAKKGKEEIVRASKAEKKAVRKARERCKDASLNIRRAASASYGRIRRNALAMTCWIRQKNRAFNAKLKERRRLNRIESAKREEESRRAHIHGEIKSLRHRHSQEHARVVEIEKELHPINEQLHNKTTEKRHIMHSIKLIKARLKELELAPDIRKEVEKELHKIGKSLDIMDEDISRLTKKRNLILGKKAAAVKERKHTENAIKQKKRMLQHG